MQRTFVSLFRRSSLVGLNRKTSTGYAGVPVIPDARKILKDLYERILDKAQALPEDFPYRIDLSNLVNHRLRIIEEEEDCAVIEERISSDQMEVLIMKARDELNEALPLMIELEWWKQPGWKEHTIPLTIRQIGDGPMDLSSFSDEELALISRRNEIEKEIAEKQKKE